MSHPGWVAAIPMLLEQFGRHSAVCCFWSQIRGSTSEPDAKSQTVNYFARSFGPFRIFPFHFRSATKLTFPDFDPIIQCVSSKRRRLRFKSIWAQCHGYGWGRSCLKNLVGRLFHFELARKTGWILLLKWWSFQLGVRKSWRMSVPVSSGPFC